MKKYLKVIVFGVLMIVMEGCVQKTIPKNDVGLKDIIDIKQLNGCYLNLADSKSSTRYLSSTLFNLKKIKDKDIKFICVKSLNSNMIKIFGKNKNHKILYKKEFLRNSDFTLNSGKILLSNNKSYAIDNMLGVSSEYIEIGLDKNEDGRLIHSGGGVIIFPIPLAVYYNNGYRFQKVVK